MLCTALLGARLIQQLLGQEWIFHRKVVAQKTGSTAAESSASLCQRKDANSPFPFKWELFLFHQKVKVFDSEQINGVLLHHIYAGKSVERLIF